MTNPKVVLVVDDEPEVLWALERRLSNEGFSVLKACNGKEAICLARTAKPDITILDIDMPEMDGGEVAAELKRYPETQNIPVVFLTCLVTKNEVQETGNTIGDKVFMSKPYDSKELIDQIKTLLSTAQPT